MRRLLAFLVLVLPFAAEQAAQQATQPTAPAQAAEQQPAPSPEPSASPSPAREDNVSGSVDLGYRWVSDISGNYNTYRSVVNLNDGFRVLGADLQVRDPNRKVFDTLTMYADNWGDPYNTARIDAERTGSYRLWFDYRNIAYFNFLPTFANPFLEQGGLVNQRSYDTYRKLIDTELQLRPGKRVVPYLAYTRDSGSGRGITPFVTPADEFPVNTDIRDHTDNYRGGVRLEMSRWHVTLEQGATAFKDDQRVYANETTPGNRSTPVLGQKLRLDALNQAYGIRGRSMYSRGLLSAAPADWLNLYGQFLFSQPRSDVNYTDDARGLFYLAATRFFNAQQSLGDGEAKQPHTSATASAELRLGPRVRVLENILTDRLHNASSLLLVQRLFFAPNVTETLNLFSADRLVMNYNRQQLDVLFDVTRKFTVRAGHRYEWGDSQVRPASLNSSGRPETGELKRNIWVLGANYRLSQRSVVNVEYEGGNADSSYFRTSLHDYQQVSARARHQLTNTIHWDLHFRFLDNENPMAGAGYELRSILGGGSIRWNPSGAKRVSVLGDYTYTAFRSTMYVLEPPFLHSVESIYRDYGHAASGFLEINLPGSGTMAPKITAGGSMFLSSGSRPTDYYQPVGKIIVPIAPRVSAFGEWRWYGLSQTFFVMEGFRTHHLTAGLRFHL